MSGKISHFLREFKLFFSILLTIIGLIIFFIAVTGIWFKDIPKNILGFSDDVLNWSLYLLIIGFIVLITGVWYLYVYIKDRKFINKELETNKRSEFVKKHAELKNTVKHMPSKYHKMLKEKEKELKIR